MTDAHQIKDLETLRTHYGAPHELAAQKSLSRLDHYCRTYIEHSPFLCIGTQSPDGAGDVSPRGDPAGFVRIVDDSTLAIPDRPGNNRLDTLENIVVNPAVGLLFMIPGFQETLRINGQAVLSTDPALLNSLAFKGKRPSLGIVVTIQEAYLHCAKAFRRSRLWEQDALQDRTLLPSLARMVLEQTSGAPDDPLEMRRIDAELEEEYQQTMY